MTDGNHVFDLTGFRNEGSVGYLNIEYDGTEYETTISISGDFIDLGIVNFLNHCLANKGYKRKLFVCFEHTTFGHEVGMSFMSKSQIKQMKNARGIRLTLL